MATNKNDNAAPNRTYTRIPRDTLKELRNEIRENKHVHQFYNYWSVKRGVKLGSIHHALCLEEKFLKRDFDVFGTAAEDRMSVDQGPRLSQMVEDSQLVTLDEIEIVLIKSGTKDECLKNMIPASLESVAEARSEYFRLKMECEKLESSVSKLSDIAKKLLD